ncbi:DUF4168 domain-containing protein [Nitratireductor soli]|uniref:DUF4168 domain-containing protein n=1 Tax=Nitratireductor soli TaxID=1670619 RepID=UPI00065DF7B6|nr:DUF4168 domain-containing protein [Nitratireductor soli]
MILRKNPRKLVAVLGVALGTALIAPVFAQDAAPAAPPAAQSQTFDDQKLEAFTVAFLAVSDVKEQYTQRFREAPSDGEKQKIQTEATQKMEQAVAQTNGISVDEYNQIIQSAQTDEALAQKLNGMIGQAAQPEN